MNEGAIIHRSIGAIAFCEAGVTLTNMEGHSMDSRRLESQGSALRRSGYPHEGR